MITRLGRIAKIDYAPMALAGYEHLDGEAWAREVDRVVAEEERELGIAIVVIDERGPNGWPVVTIVGAAADVRRARDAWGYDDDDAPIVRVGT